MSGKLQSVLVEESVDSGKSLVSLLEDLETSHLCLPCQTEWELYASSAAPKQPRTLSMMYTCMQAHQICGAQFLWLKIHPHKMWKLCYSKFGVIQYANLQMSVISHMRLHFGTFHMRTQVLDVNLWCEWQHTIGASCRPETTFPGFTSKTKLIHSISERGHSWSFTEMVLALVKVYKAKPRCWWKCIPSGNKLHLSSSKPWRDLWLAK